MLQWPWEISLTNISTLYSVLLQKYPKKLRIGFVYNLCLQLPVLFTLVNLIIPPSLLNIPPSLSLTNNHFRGITIVSITSMSWEKLALMPMPVLFKVYALTMKLCLHQVCYIMLSHAHTLTHTHSHAYTLSHAFTLSHSLSHTYSHTHIHSHTFTHNCTYSLTL